MKKLIALLILNTLLTLQLKSQLTLIPDYRFENELIALGIDTGSFADGSVPTSLVSGVTSLIINNKSISSLEGIQDFTSLEVLICYSNNLDSIDVSNNTQLRVLQVDVNNLTKLDVSNNLLLTNLSGCANQLDTLDVSNNHFLDTLIFCYNSLAYLKISDSSNFTRLDVGNAVASNRITGALDLSDDSNLVYLNINNNDFSSLNIANGANNKINELYTGGNARLACIEVDDTNYSKTNWSGSNFWFDSTTKFCSFAPVCNAYFKPKQVTSGGVFLIDSTTGSNLKYTWYFGDGDSSVTYLPTHTYATSGSYNVCLSVVDTVGGCSDTFCDTITMDSTGVLRNSWTLTVVNSEPYLSIDIITDKDIKIYPNPSNSYFIIESEKTGEYSVISLDGKILFKKTLVAKRLNNVNVLNLKSGVYFVQIKLNTGEIISKRIIKN